jgi:hypothetical protein
MTPEQFVLEYWKDYGAYMQRKEHLIEATTTLYLAFVATLLLQNWQQFWLIHFRAVAALGLLTVLLVWWFVRRQFRWWTDAARICNSCQTLMAEWLADPSTPKDLTLDDLPNSPGVKAPKVLTDAIKKRMAEWEKKGSWDKICSSPFETIVYGLSTVGAAALVVQCYWAWREVTMRPAVYLNTSGFLIGLVAALLMAFFPPRVGRYTKEGAGEITLVSNPTAKGKRWGRVQWWLSVAAPCLLALAFLLQFIALWR